MNDIVSKEIGLRANMSIKEARGKFTHIMFVKFRIKPLES